MSKPTAWFLLIGVGVTAYILGTKAGHSRYREISRTAKHFWNDPSVKKARTRTLAKVEKAARKAAKKLTP